MPSPGKSEKNCKGWSAQNVKPKHCETSSEEEEYGKASSKEEEYGKASNKEEEYAA